MKPMVRVSKDRRLVGAIVRLETLRCCARYRVTLTERRSNGPAVLQTCTDTLDEARQMVRVWILAGKAAA